MRTTITDIAKKVGVTKATVSLVLNKNPRISHKTAERVLEAAKELEYKPSASARALVRRKTENIGFLHYTTFQSLSTNPFYSKIFDGLQKELQKEEYNLLFASLECNSKKELLLPKILKEHNIDGLIIIGVRDRAFISHLAREEIPTVLIDDHFPVQNMDFIVLDNKPAIYNVVKYLYRLGHRSIGYLDSEVSSSSFSERLAGYQKALREFSLKEILIAKGIPCVEGGDETIKQISSSSLPSAIFCANDGLAIGAMKAIKEKGLRIPEDISIIGFDDQEMASYTDPPLTTVRVPKEEMGRLAVRRVLERVNGERKKAVVDIVKTELIIRSSCRKID